MGCRRLTSLVVLFHGYASNGADIRRHVAPALVGFDVEVAALDGPEEAQLKPGTRQWFGITGIEGEGFRRAAPAVQIAIDKIAEIQDRVGAEDKSTLLVGFSQGGVVAAAVAAAVPVAVEVVAICAPLPRALLDEYALPQSPPLWALFGGRDRFVLRTREELPVSGPVHAVHFPAMGHEIGEEALEVVRHRVASLVARRAAAVMDPLAPFLAHRPPGPSR